MSYINEKATLHRNFWINNIIRASGNFIDDSLRIEQRIKREVNASGIISLMDHLRLCTAIPESYVMDSSEEKLYSKYTDALISECFNFIGLTSVVLSQRADAADVEVYCKDFSFVADAKVFRLSRTAKNQKDFKIQALDSWRQSNDYAMVVCPIYQLPIRSSQIYQQAIVRNVCIFSYTHLGVLVRYSENNNNKSIELLHKIFQSLSGMMPSKDSVQYWKIINQTMLSFDKKIQFLWGDEKKATDEGIMVSKKIALDFFSNERRKILSMTRQEAVSELIKINQIDSKEQTVQNISNNMILSF